MLVIHSVLTEFKYVRIRLMHFLLTRYVIITWKFLLKMLGMH